MTIRSVVLFTHVIGMLVLFVGLALECFSLESLRHATTSEQASSWARLQRVLPRVYGIAYATLLASGISLARGVGVLEFAWVRLALGLMVVMAILGPVVRHASHPWLRASLYMRIAMALAVVYLMLGKPFLIESLVVTGVAVAIGLAIGLRAQ